MKKIYTIAFAISLTLVVASIVALILYGLNFGVDFKGGSVLELRFNANRPAVTDLQAALGKIDFLTDPGVTVSGSQGVIIRSGELTEAQHQQILDSLKSSFPNGNIEEIRFDSIGPVIGSELRSRSIRAIIILLLAIATYIAFVFRKLSRSLSPWVMSFATMIALAHDVVIPLGIFAILGHFQGVEISAVFVAAVLTILGYSISDTVVVFDRVRENIVRGMLSRESFGTVVHVSIKQTLVRSINTTATTLLALVAIFLFGGDSIKYFSLAMILGITFGSYSSIFVASPLLVWFSRKHRTG